MKLITVLSVISLLFAIPAFSTLTVADIEKIRSIIKALDKRLTGEIETLGERCRGHRDTTNHRRHAAKRYLIHILLLILKS